MLDPELRHRILALLGIEVRGSRRPYPGQKWRHGWIPTAFGLAAKWHSDDDIDGLKDLASIVESGEVEFEPFGDGSMATVERVTYNDGVTVYKLLEDVEDVMGHGFEPKRQADAEQLTAQLGGRIGAPVPRVLRISKDEIHMDLVPGTTAKHLSEDEIEAIAKTDDGIRLGLFDLLTDNFDRQSPDNWMITPDGKPVGIDHSFTFWTNSPGAKPPDTANIVGPFAKNFLRLTPDGWEWANNPLTREDIVWLRERLAAIEAAFNARGRHDWWKFAMARLEAIAQFATGTQSRFAQ